MKNWTFSHQLSFRNPTCWATVGLTFIHVLLAYYGDRQQIWTLWALVGLAFIFYFVLIHKKTIWTPKYVLIAAVAFRIPYLGQEPLLSDDFYRFFWDGQLWITGYNAYEWLPTAFISAHKIPLFFEVFPKLNSPHYYTVYPALNQYLFTLAAFLGGEDVKQFTCILQIILFSLETTILWITLKLSTNQNIKTYYLNPLIPLEFIGNLHFEGLLVSFLVLSYIIHIRYSKLWITSVFWALAVATKLTPLIFAPLIWLKLSPKRRLSFFTIAFFINILLFLPLLQLSTLEHILSSINLYFQHFEFNASIYFIARWVGNIIYGYNPIAIVGPLLSIITFFGIWWISYFFKNHRIESVALWIQTFFLLMATTVHPWYLFPLILFASLSEWRFPIVWSLFIFLTYFSYTTSPYEENLFLVSLEYAIVGVFGWMDYKRQKNRGDFLR